MAFSRRFQLVEGEVGVEGPHLGLLHQPQSQTQLLHTASSSLVCSWNLHHRPSVLQLFLHEFLQPLFLCASLLSRPTFPRGLLALGDFLPESVSGAGVLFLQPFFLERSAFCDLEEERDCVGFPFWAVFFGEHK